MYRFKFHHGFIGRYISDIWGYDVFCHCWCAQLPLRFAAFVQNLGPSMWRGKFDNEAVAMTAIVMTWLPWKSWALLVPDPIGSFDVGMEWQYWSYWCLVMDGLLGAAGMIIDIDYIYIYIYVIMDHSRKFPAFSTSKWFIMCALAEFKSNADMWIMWMRPAQTIWIILTHNNHRWLISLPPRWDCSLWSWQFSKWLLVGGLTVCCLPQVQHN